MGIKKNPLYGGVVLQMIFSRDALLLNPREEFNHKRLLKGKKTSKLPISFLSFGTIYDEPLVEPLCIQTGVKKHCFHV